MWNTFTITIDIMIFIYSSAVWKRKTTHWIKKCNICWSCCLRKSIFECYIIWPQEGCDIPSSSYRWSDDGSISGIWSSRKQQTTLKIQIKQEICVLSICVSVIYRLILWSICYIIINHMNFNHESSNIFILVYAKKL